MLSGALKVPSSLLLSAIAQLSRFFASLPPWLVPSSGGRVAIVIADNLKTHTSAGSLLVRSMLNELQEHLYLAYTPAYDPDANRHSYGTGLVSQRVVTHNHHRTAFALLLADMEKHFQALAQTPLMCFVISAALLRQPKMLPS